MLDAAARLSERYITDRFLPDKAIDLLDEAASHISLSSLPLNEKAEKEKALAVLQSEKSELEGKMTSEAEGEKSEALYAKLADIRVRELQLTDRLAELETECAAVEMTASDLADVIEIWTGIPASDIRESEFEQLDRLDARIKERIIGQDEAVSAVVRAIRRKRTGVSTRRSPVSMIFAGPTGVGKTELVKVLAEDLFKQPDTLIRLDMSEYMEKHSVSRIIGAPPGYVGYDEAGQLTEKIRRRPYSVILFDEMEKAHPDIFNLLLQVLDNGELTDARGRSVSFRNTVIIMTSNLGAGGKSRSVGFSAHGGGRWEEEKAGMLAALKNTFRPEFLNRIDETVVFSPLDGDALMRIASLLTAEVAERMEGLGYSLSFTEAAISRIAREGETSEYGARPLRRAVIRLIEEPLSTGILEGKYQEGASLLCDAEGEEMVIRCVDET
jgi:ATP-dependent Clp protease ATP-binding subunit ClpA